MRFRQTFECLMSNISNLFVFQFLKLELVPNLEIIFFRITIEWQLLVLNSYNSFIQLLIASEWKTLSLKLVSAIFIKFLFFHQMIALQKLWKILFISSKKLFSFSRYSNVCIFVLPFFFYLLAIAFEDDRR